MPLVNDMRKRKKIKQNDGSYPKSGVRERIATSVAMPIETFFNISQMQVIGNREVTVEGYKEIVTYDDTLLRIRAKGMDISFWGSDLELNYMNDENIVISGKIEQIEFLTQ